MVHWVQDRVSTAASIDVPKSPSGAELRDAYAEEVRAMTFGLVTLRDDAIVLGPLELLRFGPPKVTRHAVEWSIQGGVLSARPGGTLRTESRDGRVVASLEGWTPRLPRLLYVPTQLQVHLLFTRLYLLRLRGSEPAPDQRASRRDRLNAAAVDIAVCLTLAGLTVRRRPRRVLAIAAIAASYHVACWSASGRTLGGLVMRQRVVASDGSRVAAAQALFRLALLPASWITRRPVHDELAATAVIRG
jgi:hypothetical protein